MPKLKKSKKLLNPAAKGYHLAFYVENSSPCMRSFSSKESLDRFVEEFQEAHPLDEAIDTGFWIDYIVTDVRGTVTDLSQ